MEPCVADCFPPTPIYVTAGVLAAMLMTVTNKVEDIHDAVRKGVYRGFSTFLLILTTIPFFQLAMMIFVNANSSQCRDHNMLLWCHFLTILPLLGGLAYWVSRSVGVRLRNPLSFD